MNDLYSQMFSKLYQQKNQEEFINLDDMYYINGVRLLLKEEEFELEWFRKASEQGHIYAQLKYNNYLQKKSKSVLS